MIIYKITTTTDHDTTDIVAYAISQKIAEDYITKNYFPLFRNNICFFTYTEKGRIDIRIEPTEVLEQI